MVELVVGVALSGVFALAGVVLGHWLHRRGLKPKLEVSVSLGRMPEPVGGQIVAVILEDKNELIFLHAKNPSLSPATVMSRAATDRNLSIARN